MRDVPYTTVVRLALDCFQSWNNIPGILLYCTISAMRTIYYLPHTARCGGEQCDLPSLPEREMAARRLSSQCFLRGWWARLGATGEATGAKPQPLPADSFQVLSGEN